MAEEKRSFQAEVSKLLDIVVHSLYSNKEIFLRELISNASDACDKLRYQAQTQPDLLEGNADYSIKISVDREKRTITIADNGIGMNRDDLNENLGTIARSGTSAFLNQISGDSRKDINLIGQFGVGFYSAFMVANKVEVITRKAGDKKGWHWWSEGTGDYTIDSFNKADRGAKIILHLREGENDFLENYRLKSIIKTYSDHIALPVYLNDGEKDEQVNSASALWVRPKSEVTDEQYKDFYRHVSHAFDEPWLTHHFKAEGAIEYSGLLFIPTEKPFDIFNPDRKQNLKLYVNRIFITDDCEELLPSYLRFVRGVVDSHDLPLNVSREMLQHNPLLAKIKSGLIKRILGELKKKSKDSENHFDKFWSSFGAVLKEGLYEDFERREEILDLCRFRTTLSDEPIPLSLYVERMKEGQTAIYTITGDNLDSLKRSPQLEGFTARNVEVLLLTDPIDTFWPSALQKYKEHNFRSVAQGSADLSEIKKDQKEDDKVEAEAGQDELTALIESFKKTLGEAVKDVRSSDRLTESPVCLVADEGDMGIHMERMLRQHQQETKQAPRIMEINPRHSLIRRLSTLAKNDTSNDHIADAAWLLLGQACIIEGTPLSDTSAFAKRLAGVLERSV
jgi:molecular chaperone HtpG